MRLILVFLMLVIAGCDRFDPRFPADPMPPVNPDTDTAHLSRDRPLSEHNFHRGRAGIDSLKRDLDLEHFAQNHANWMAKRDSLRHSNLDVSGWGKVGENIAWGQTSENRVTTSWMRSPGHKKNILDEDFTHVGFGYAYSAEGRIYWCAVFGG